MPVITLSDGRKLIYNSSVSLFEIANDISPNLVKNFCFGNVNDISLSRDTIISYDAYVEIIYNNNLTFLNIIRNTFICILGHAAKELWPNVKIGTGSVIENGFYCDIECDFVFTSSHMSLLESQMLNVCKRKYKVCTHKVTWEKAHKIFQERSEKYKLLVLKNDFDGNKSVSLCFHQNYVDFQFDIAVPDVSFCKYFKLLKFSGVYWDRNKENKILQRIYGTAWASSCDLKKYLEYIAQSEKRDHRKLSKRLDLYHLQEESPGMIFWHHNGMIIFRELKTLIREKLQRYCYQEVKTPSIMDIKIWEKSGHLDNYQDLMFMTSSEKNVYGIKPMNCPGHVQIFNNVLHSYRDLPVRISEFGSCHRNEPSGSLHGLMRIRHFTQDDAHIFCREDQVCDEISNCIKMIYDVYEVFGFKKILVKLSTRPENRIGSDAIWDRAEDNLKFSLKENNILFEYQKGEGAFYGPKIELSLLDCLGRVWQCATIQLDFYLPMNLGAFYIDENNAKVVPIIIHRAVLGSIERFIGILIEEYSGNFPTWISPVQVVIISVNRSHIKYAEKLFNSWFYLGIRVKLDVRSEKVSFKIRECIVKKIPYIIICGDKEVAKNKVTFRTRSGKNVELVDIQYFVSKLQKEIVNRSLHLLEE
ncbi:MAG: threonine--tRNA ligase [Buchnera aphidicola (Schlechtendalia chinensis)]